MDINIHHFLWSRLVGIADTFGKEPRPEEAVSIETSL